MTNVAQTQTTETAENRHSAIPCPCVRRTGRATQVQWIEFCTCVAQPRMVKPQKIRHCKNGRLLGARHASAIQAILQRRGIQRATPPHPLCVTLHDAATALLYSTCESHHKHPPPPQRSDMAITCPDDFAQHHAFTLSSAITQVLMLYQRYSRRIADN